MNLFKGIFAHIFIADYKLFLQRLQIIIKTRGLFGLFCVLLHKN